MISSALRVVSNDKQEPPYPNDTRAKGWQFQIDYERLEQSDTWCLATIEMRPWLLMLFVTAWKQTPCGSMPNDDQLISARIGMDIRQFKAHRDILLRGWFLASDDRLYHKVITEQVIHMLNKRQSAAKKVCDWRNKKKQQLTENVTSNMMVTNQLVTTPVPEPVPIKTKKHTRFAAREYLLGFGLDEQTISDWLAIRKEKKLVPTKTAIDAIEKEAAKSNMTLCDAITICCTEGWAGFKSAWLEDEKHKNKKNSSTAEWWATESATLAKGLEFGLQPRGGEGWPEFRGRIRDAMAKA